MRNVRPRMRTALLGLVAVYAVAGLVLAGCSDDTGTSPENDGSADGPSTSDVIQADAADAAPDQDAAKVDAMPDSGADVVGDAAPNDSSDAADAQDATQMDAGDADSATVGEQDAKADSGDAATHDGPVAKEDAADAKVDAEADAHDATVDVVDGEADAQDATVDVVDAAPDVYVCPTALKTYPQQYAAAYCYGIGNCCPGYGDGGFDLPTCLSQNDYVGWDNTLPDDPSVLCRGNMTIDEDASAGCLAQLSAYGCGTEVSASAFAALIHACQNVLIGHLQIDAGGCVTSFECVDGAYCYVSQEAGSGTCLPLVGDGGACSSDEMCRAASSGQPMQFCDVDLTGNATGVCTPMLPDDAGCSGPVVSYDDRVCASLQCGDPQTCGSPAGLDQCIFYPPPDAGGD
ncbi:MAG: Dickkopf N-terminal cysteine-rich domain-containing protein [Polyangiaceae bacterium]